MKRDSSDASAIVQLDSSFLIFTFSKSAAYIKYNFIQWIDLIDVAEEKTLKNFLKLTKHFTIVRHGETSVKSLTRHS